MTKIVALVIGLFALSCSGSGGIGAVSCGVGPPQQGDVFVLRNFTLIDGEVPSITAGGGS